MFIRYLINLLGLVFTLSLIFTGMIYNHFRLQMDAVTENLMQKIEAELNLISLEFDHTRQDLLYLARDQDILSFAQSKQNQENPELIVDRLINLLRNRTHYDRIRYIDNQGQEILSVSLNQGSPQLRPPQHMQNDSQLEFIAQSLDLKPSQVSVSGLSLGVIDGQVAVPLKPVMYFSTALFNIDGNLTGVLLIDYLGKSVLQHFKQNNESNLMQFMLVNQDAYYLVNPHAEQEWAFMFRNDPQYLFSTQFPQVWAQIQQSNSGVFDKNNRIFVFSSLSQYPAMQSLQNCSICNWSAIAYLPPEVLRNKIVTEAKKLLHIFLLFLAIGALILWYIMKFNQQRHDSENQLALLNKIIKNERDLFINGPTIVFNWRDQYGWPVDYVSENIQSVLGYSAASFINNELSYSSIVAPEFLSQIADDLAKARQQNLKSFELRPYQVVDSEGNRKWLRHFSLAVRNQKNHITHYYGYVNDISQLKQTEEELEKSREYVHNLLETLPHPTVVIDVKNYQILLANEAAKALYNDGESIPEGMTCYHLSHHKNTPCEGSDDPCPIQQILQHKKSAKVVHRHFVSAGSEIYVELMSRPVFNEQGEIVQIIESQRDITHHIITERRLTHQATTDPLTEAYNRFKFDNEIKFQLEIARKHERNLGLIMFDLDDFKLINDKYGHDVGDLALKTVAHLARESIRKTDILARWGGEEFMILLPDTQLHVAEKIAEDLRQTINNYPFSENCRLSASFGVTLSDIADTDSELLKRVDNALYQSKNEGKNRVTTLLSNRD